MHGHSGGRGMWINFPGEVISGKGEGRRFVESTWVKKQIASKIGFTPYPGTFNVRITDDAGKEAVEKMRRSITNAIGIVPPGGRGCYGSCFIAKIADAVDGAVIIPSEGGHGDVVEFVAAVAVKNMLAICDGDKVSVKVRIPLQ